MGMQSDETIQGLHPQECTDAQGLKARNIIAWVEGALATEAQVGVATTIQACRAETPGPNQSRSRPFRALKLEGILTWAFGRVRSLRPRLYYCGLSALRCHGLTVW